MHISTEVCGCVCVGTYVVLSDSRVLERCRARYSCTVRLSSGHCILIILSPYIEFVKILQITGNNVSFCKKQSTEWQIDIQTN